MIVKCNAEVHNLKVIILLLLETWQEHFTATQNPCDNRFILSLIDTRRRKVVKRWFYCIDSNISSRAVAAAL